MIIIIIIIINYYNNNNDITKGYMKLAHYVTSHEKQ